MESLGNPPFLLMDGDDIFNFPLDGEDGDDHSRRFPVSFNDFWCVFILFLPFGDGTWSGFCLTRVLNCVLGGNSC